ncbi:MAG TPA: hypothetical protein VFO70_08540, partial [Chitinophagaceae bacterium]|nr:hypothetical protein [Chitinophagaceae bacterium]
MLDNGSKGISYTAGFFMLIAFAIAGAILAGFIYAPIWTSMTGKSIKALGEGLIDPGDSDAMKIVQTISAIVGFFLPAVFTAWLLSRRPMRLLGFSTRIRPGHLTDVARAGNALWRAAAIDPANPGFEAVNSLLNSLHADLENLR